MEIVSINQVVGVDTPVDQEELAVLLSLEVAVGLMVAVFLVAVVEQVALVPRAVGVAVVKMVAVVRVDMAQALVEVLDNVDHLTQAQE